MNAEETKVTFVTLKSELLQTLEDNSYSPGTLKLYRENLNRIHTYMIRKKLEFYGPEVGAGYLKYMVAQKTPYAEHTLRFFRTVVRRVDDCYYGRDYVLSIPRKDLSVSEAFQGVLNTYYNYCCSIGNSKTTIKMKERAGHEFCTNLYSNGCHSFNELTVDSVIKAILMENNHEYWPCIKDLLSYLTYSDTTEKDYSTLVPRNRRGFKLPSTYSTEEIILLEHVIDKTKPPGKRDYAMILLASRLGIRAGDIASLRFDAFDFQSERVRFVQKKTGVSLNLPMLPEIMEAVRNYIVNERPQSDLDYVFLSSFAPYKEISYSVVSFAVKKYMKVAGIDTSGKRHGPHSLRSSLATSMVNDSVEYDAVRKILGHDSSNAIKYYAKLDIEKLRRCGLESYEATGYFRQFLEGRRNN